MQPKIRDVLAALGALVLSGDALAQWRCDCTRIVGSCQATATVRESFIEVTSNVEQCARVDYLVDGRPFVALVVDGSDRQDFIVGSESPAVIVQSCQVCVDNAGAAAAPEAAGAGAGAGGAPTRIIGVSPVYPPAAAAAGIEGYVDVRFTVSASGMVVAPEIVAAEPAGVFDQAALAAVSRWRYTQTGAESESITERIEFDIADQILSLTARSAAQVSAAAGARRNDCIREESRFDFGQAVDVSLINACNEPLIVYSCAAGTGAYRDRWICNDPERSATMLRPSGISTGGTAVVATPPGSRELSAVGRLEVTRAPNGEYWWLACSVDNAACRDDGRAWIRSLDGQLARIDPQDRTRARLARSY